MACDAKEKGENYDQRSHKLLLIEAVCVSILCGFSQI